MLGHHHSVRGPGVIRRLSRLGIGLTPVLFLLACDSDSQPLAPQFTVQDEELQAMLFDAIQDEYHAQAVYEAVLSDFGDVMPFVNIIKAEARHAGAIAGLYASRGWEVPVSVWSVDNVPRFESPQAACAVGVDAEIANVAIYDGWLGSGTLPADVIQVFSSNRRASLEKHLPAFQSCM